MNNNDTVASRLRALRIENHLSLSQFGAKAGGVTKGSVQSWENGYSVPTLDKMVLIAKAFNVSLDYLAGITDEDVVKITKLDREQKSIIFTMIKYFETINEKSSC